MVLLLPGSQAHGSRAGCKINCCGFTGITFQESLFLSIRFQGSSSKSTALEEEMTSGLCGHAEGATGKYTACVGFGVHGSVTPMRRGGTVHQCWGFGLFF